MNILVTGGSGDIGNAICQKLSQNNQVIALSRTDLDLSNIEAVNSWVKMNSQLKIDAIVLCAGINNPQKLLNFEYSDFKSTFDVNFSNQMQLVLKLIPQMVSQNFGRIVAVSSLYSSKVREGRFNYSVSKSALEQFIKYLALEFGPYGILSNFVIPGFIDTKLTRKNNSQAKIDELESHIPLGKLGTVLDVAEATYFLVSESNNYINGQGLIVDGGYSLC